MSSEALLSEYRDEQSVTSSRNMEARAEHQRTKSYITLYGATTILGSTLVIMVFVWIMQYRGGFAWSVEDPVRQFNWHPFLMVLGLLFLYSQSILIYRTGRTVLKRKLKLTHAALHGAAFILAVIALQAAFASHNNAKPSPTPNLYTLHSWIGLITVIIFAGQYLLGFITFLYPGLAKCLRLGILPVHTAIGTAGFLMALISCMMGFMEKAIWVLGDNYKMLVREGILINIMGVITVFFGVLVLYLVNEIGYKRVSLPEDEMALTSSERAK